MQVLAALVQHPGLGCRWRADYVQMQTVPRRPKDVVDDASGYLDSATGVGGTAGIDAMDRADHGYSSP
jgi:hypothetical protein